MLINIPTPTKLTSLGVYVNLIVFKKILFYCDIMIGLV